MRLLLRCLSFPDLLAVAFDEPMSKNRRGRGIPLPEREEGREGASIS